MLADLSNRGYAISYGGQQPAAIANRYSKAIDLIAEYFVFIPRAAVFYIVGAVILFSGKYESFEECQHSEFAEFGEPFTRKKYLPGYHMFTLTSKGA